MKSSKISDIESIQKLLNDIKGFKSLKAVSPLLFPLFQLLGVKTDSLKQPFSEIEKLEKQVLEFSSIPDRFNDLFLSSGWIMYGDMNLDIAKAAIKEAEKGNNQAAEDILVKYHNAETVTWNLRRMNGLQTFRPRMNLVNKAFIDYVEGRYHACIPLVLALMDGLVSELHEKRRGIFSEEADLEAWDSIAAHNKGLNELAKIMRKSRQTTRTEEIHIPYRNGILHGMDLGYDNQIVAAKTWAALFAVREWAVKAEQGLIKAPKKTKEKGWKELLNQIKENEETKKMLEAWKPRNVDIKREFELNTPESKVIEFIELWKKNNYGYMSNLVSHLMRTSELVVDVRNHYKSKLLGKYEIVEIIDEAPAISEIKLKVNYIVDNNEVEKEIIFRMICEDANGDPIVRDKEGSEWTILNWNIV